MVVHQELCKTVHLDESDVCVPIGVDFTKTDADSLKDLLQPYRGLNHFLSRCPWSSTLERSAARQSPVASTPEDKCASPAPTPSLRTTGPA